MRNVLREEKKFLIIETELRKKSHFLHQFLTEDPHNGVNGYPIRSLYFDTLNDDDFRDKMDGVEIRRKIRLRCYDPEGNFAMLEMKQKQGAMQRKRSLKLSREAAERLIACDYTPLLERKEAFARECYGLMQYQCYRPKTIVEYRRKAFIAKENRIRITFDSNITATESCFDLFSSRLNMNPVMDRSLSVLEVKFDGFLLSYIREMLNSIDKSELSVSKYCLARQHGCPANLL